MRTSIYKYTIPDSLDLDNYFDRSSNLILYDKFVTNRQLINGFPIFREEWSEDENVNLIKSGFFDLKLSTMMPETSSVHARNISEFFEIDGQISKYKFIVVCETDNPDRNYSGVVDINSLRSKFSLKNNDHHVYIPVTGIETEVVSLLKSKYWGKIPTDKIFETQYLNFLFYSARIQIESQLDLHSKLGYHLTVDKLLQNKMWDENLDATGTFSVISNWEAFRSFVVGYSFRFKLIFTGTDAIGPVYKLIVFFRSKGINEANVVKKMSEGKGLTSGGSYFVAIFYTKRNDHNDDNLTHYTGFIMSRTNIYITSNDVDIVYQAKEDTYRYGAIYFDAKTILRIDLSLFNANLSAGDTAICRLVPGQSINPLLTYIANVELGYLLKGVKKKREYDVKVLNDSNLSLGSLVSIDDQPYVCERINSYDNYNKTMKAEFIEI
jgi:hypothetical protein